MQRVGSLRLQDLRRTGKLQLPLQPIKIELRQLPGTAPTLRTRSEQALCMTDEVLASESTSCRRPPRNLRVEDVHLFSHEAVKAIPATRLLNRRNVGVSPDGILFRHGHVLPESFAYPSQEHQWRTWRTRLRLLADGTFRARLNTIPEQVFWITDSQSFEYFHWMTDALPRLFAVRDRIQDGRILLPHAYRSFAYVSATLESFPQARVGFVERLTRCRCLRIPTHTAPTGNYNEAIIRGLRDHLQSHLASVSAAGRGERVYVSRTHGSRRKIVNEQDMVAAIEPLGFKLVHFEDHSFQQQVAIAMHARYLVSNHGAGLTNMFFMRSGSRVLELRRDADTHFNCYYSMASALGLDYFYQNCPTRMPGEETHTADLVVDVAALRENLKLMLES